MTFRWPFGLLLLAVYLLTNFVLLSVAI